MQRTWRVMGMWEDGRHFLVVMGTSRTDCRRRLDEALSEYDYADFEGIDSLWLEFWRPGTKFREAEWYPESEIALRRFKLIRAADRHRQQVLSATA